jgi:hypothetical protein
VKETTNEVKETTNEGKKKKKKKKKSGNTGMSFIEWRSKGGPLDENFQLLLTCFYELKIIVLMKENIFWPSAMILGYFVLIFEK